MKLGVKSLGNKVCVEFVSKMLKDGLGNKVCVEFVSKMLKDGASPTDAVWHQVLSEVFAPAKIDGWDQKCPRARTRTGLGCRQ